MTLAILCGAVAGFGLFLIARQFVRSDPGVAATLARIDAGRRGQLAATRSAVDRPSLESLERLQSGLGARLEVEVLARGWKFTNIRADLAVLNRPFANHLATKVLLSVAGFVVLPTMMTLLGYATLSSVIVGLFAGAILFLVPDARVKSRAESRRRDFRHVMGAFLDLVAMNLSGGRGLPEALMTASTIGDHWAMARIRQALSNARLVGITPWEGIARLGKELDIEELRDLASALALAGDEGATIRSSLMARAESLRRKELAMVEGAAGERSQSMLVAQLMLCGAFLLFLAYPATTKIMGT
ncbi:MAG: type II secretion system protein [Propionibacteriales bacterium]|nr:type II secretion system protein [Propionibacteriales bacterium]